MKRRLILTLLDGQALEPVKLPDDFKLDIISALEAATDQEFTFSNYSNGSAFRGFADDLTVFGRVLDAAEMAALYAGTKEERSVFQQTSMCRRKLKAGPSDGCWRCSLEGRCGVSGGGGAVRQSNAQYGFHALLELARSETEIVCNLGWKMFQ